MDISALEEMLAHAESFRDKDKLTVQEVNTLRTLADMIIYDKPNVRSFDAFDVGLRFAVHYMWVIRQLVDQRILERISTTSPVFFDYFNRNMRFVQTGKLVGKNSVWDGMIVNAIKSSLHEQEDKPRGNIGASLLWSSETRDPRGSITENNTMRVMETAPLNMSDPDLVLRWITHVSGFEEMMLFIARMAEIYYLVLNKKD